MGGVILDDLKYVNIPEKVLQPYVLRRGDVLFNRTNSQEWVGKVGIYRAELDTVFASYLIRLIPDTMKIDNYYLGHVLGSYSAQCRIKRYATPGVQQVNMNATNLGKVLIPVPVGKYAVAEQNEIALTLEAADSVIRSHESVVARQQALKTSLTHDLLTGRVRVKSPEEAVAS
jgi:type I restriction enzyme, S subunit